MSRKAVLTVLALVASCGTAHVVYQTGNVGTIELTGDQQKAMAQANEELVTVCGANNASIVSQGYERSGTPVDAPAPPHTGSGSSGATADAPHEGMLWRIHFQCGAAAPTAPPPPAVAAPAPAAAPPAAPAAAPAPAPPAHR